MHTRQKFRDRREFKHTDTFARLMMELVFLKIAEQVARKGVRYIRGARTANRHR